MLSEINKPGNEEDEESPLTKTEFNNFNPRESEDRQPRTAGHDLTPLLEADEGDESETISMTPSLENMSDRDEDDDRDDHARQAK